MPDIEVKNTVKLFALLLLSERKQHGYELMKEIESKLGRKTSPGQIYPFLKQLKKYRYIDSKGRTERDKQVYYLTPGGRRFVGRLSDKFGDLFEIAIKPKLTICIHCSCEIYKGGYKEKVGDRYLDFCCKNCAKSYTAMKKR